MLCWHAANLDPETHPDPHAFRLDRKEAAHLSFGAGVHVCPGASLALMQLQLVLERLLTRRPAVRLAGEMQERLLGSDNIIAVTSLPLAFG
jgi:cytochrome P450 family 142 subfamily A polypeptide 1